MRKSKGEWASYLNQKGVLVVFDPDRLDKTPQAHPPHAVHDGEHWDGFYFGQFLTNNQEMAKEAAKELIELFMEANGPENPVTHVMGIRSESEHLVKAMAVELSGRGRRLCSYSLPRKEGGGAEVWLDFRGQHEPRRGNTVLLVDNSMRLTPNVELMVKAINRKGAEIAEYLCTPFNGTGCAELSVHGHELKPIVLVERAMRHWKGSECVLCKHASRPLDVDDLKKHPEYWTYLHVTRVETPHAS